MTDIDTDMAAPRTPVRAGAESLVGSSSNPMRDVLREGEKYQALLSALAKASAPGLDQKRSAARARPPSQNRGKWLGAGLLSLLTLLLTAVAWQYLTRAKPVVLKDDLNFEVGLSTDVFAIMMAIDIDGSCHVRDVCG